MSGPNQEERAKAQTGLPLSCVMHQLLASLMTAIDRRLSIITAMGEGEKDYAPDTCEACGGTGIVLILSSDGKRLEMSDDGSNARSGYAESDDDDTSNYGGEAESELDLHNAATAGPDIVPTGAAAQAPAASQLAPGPSALAQPAIAQTNASSPQAPSAPAPAVAAPAAALAPMSRYGPVPAPSAVIPGNHSLGPNRPVPDPANAVFGTPGGDRYYAVTKGIRVGVFRGWLNTTAYVTKVPSAAHSKHSNIEEAFEDYYEAWQTGLVAYV